MSEYSRAHVAVSKVYGPAKNHPCVTCGGPAHDWSLFCLDQGQSDGGLLWSSRIEDYEAQCKSCHQRLEYSRGTNRGWKTFWAEEKSPAWKAAFAESSRKNGVAARERLAELQADPIEGPRIRARQSAGSKKAGGFQRRRCVECGRESNAPGVAAHQRATGHTGVEKLP